MLYKDIAINSAITEPDSSTKNKAVLPMLPYFNIIFDIGTIDCTSPFLRMNKVE